MISAPYKSAVTLRRDNCLSELTSNVALKTRTLSNLGLSIAGAGAPLSLDIQASENIPNFSMVTISGNKANSLNSAHLEKVVGLAPVGVLNGFISNVVTNGIVTNPAWSLAVSSPIYLNGTSLSQTPSDTGFVQRVGIAKNATTLYVDLAEPILL